LDKTNGDKGQRQKDEDRKPGRKNRKTEIRRRKTKTQSEDEELKKDRKQTRGYADKGEWRME
jgi:hypothetical protein